MRLETERLVLRPFVHADAPRVLDIHSRLEVVRWLSDPPYVLMADLDEARRWIDNWGTGEVGPARCGLAIEVRETGIVAGTVMITTVPNAEHDERQIGWHLHPDSFGHGYATEASARLIDEAFAGGLEEIWCDMFPDNLASAKVAERLGLRALGVVPDPWYEGEGRLFHATRDEWCLKGPGEPVK